MAYYAFKLTVRKNDNNFCGWVRNCVNSLVWQWLTNAQSIFLWQFLYAYFWHSENLHFKISNFVVHRTQADFFQIVHVDSNDDAWNPFLGFKPL